MKICAFFNRLGAIRDRSVEEQRYRASAVSIKINNPESDTLSSFSRGKTNGLEAGHH